MKKHCLFILFFIPIFALNIYFGYLVIWKNQNEWVPVTNFLALIVLFVVVYLNRK